MTETPRDVRTIAVRRRQESAERRKQTYWVIRKSDERIIKANDAISRTRTMLRAAGKSPRKREPEPDLAWGNLLIFGSQNPKRRADD